MEKQAIILSSIGTVVLFSIFLGYTYFTDAQALYQIESEIVGIEHIDPKLTSATLTYTLSITNPSSKPINDLSSEFEIYIESNYIGTGSFSDIDINPESTTKKSMTVTIYYSGLAKAGIDALENWASGQDTTLVIDGTMRASILFGLTEASQDFIAST